MAEGKSHGEYCVEGSGNILRKFSSKYQGQNCLISANWLKEKKYITYIYIYKNSDDKKGKTSQKSNAL